MIQPNENIQIYNGALTLVFSNNCSTIVCGKVIYEWLPIPVVHFYCDIIEGTNAALIIENALEPISIIIDQITIGKGHITNFTYPEDNPHVPIKFKGEFVDKIIVGDKELKTNEIKFHITNMRALVGHKVKYENENSVRVMHNRILFETNSYNIIIDAIYNPKDRLSQLKNAGGFLFMYNGTIKPKKNKINYSTANEIIESFSFFISFIAGTKTFPSLIYANINNNQKWLDATNYDTSIYQNNYFSWFPFFSNNEKEINLAFNNFNYLWENENNKNFLKTIVTWYNSLNQEGIFIYSHIIMAQSAMELIFNWWIIEQKELIKGKDSEKLSASNKIRQILSFLNISDAIPFSCNSLRGFKKTDNNFKDAPDTIVYIRNAIIHSSNKKRERLSDISIETLNETTEIYRSYIELSLLRILEYNGKYKNRFTKVSESVPWRNMK